MLLCHGTPDSDTTYLLRDRRAGRPRADRDTAEVTRRLDGEQRRIVLCGHSHMARMVALDDGRLVVNPGSVGLPAYTDIEPVRAFDGDGRAARALRRAGTQARPRDPWQVSFRVVAYDWNGAADAPPQKGREDWAHWIRTGYAGASARPSALQNPHHPGKAAPLRVPQRRDALAVGDD